MPFTAFRNIGRAAGGIEAQRDITDAIVAGATQMNIAIVVEGLIKRAGTFQYRSGKLLAQNANGHRRFITTRQKYRACNKHCQKLRAHVLHTILFVRSGGGLKNQFENFDRAMTVVKIMAQIANLKLRRYSDEVGV